MGLKGKRILITAGPTWVPIDNVRVLSNIATGETGVLLARQAAAQGARVTLLIGPSGECNLNKSIQVIRLRFFNELKNILKRELKNNTYDIIIHSAAVSDFYPVRKKFPKEKRLSNGFKPTYKLGGKLSSNRAHSLKLVPLEKLVVMIRHLAGKTKLVMFKLETAVTDRALIQRAKKAAKKVNADLVVANRLNPYRAFIIEKGGKQILVKNKQQLARRLVEILSNSFNS